MVWELLSEGRQSPDTIANVLILGKALFRILSVNVNFLLEKVLEDKPLKVLEFVMPQIN